MKIIDQIAFDALENAVNQKSQFEKFFQDKSNTQDWLEMSWELFSYAARIVNPQLSAPIIEKKICKIYGWNHTKNNKSKGDAIDEFGQSIEIKCSFITSTNQSINVKQARVDWDDSAYRVFAMDGISLYRFDLTHGEIQDEILIFGASKTHKNGSDYSFGVPWSIKNNDFNRWMSKYLSPHSLNI